MIDVQNSLSQQIDIDAIKSNQKIVIQNADEQSIAVKEKYESEDIRIEIFHCPQKIEIGRFCPCEESLKIEIDSKVPKELSILPPTQIYMIDTSSKRETSRMYLDINGTPSYATLEQIKNLNTKTIYVDHLNDNKINYLSNEDIILLKQE